MNFQLSAYLLLVKRDRLNKLFSVAPPHLGHKRSTLLSCLLLAVLSIFTVGAHASGVLPESSAVIINEAQKGGSINVKNTESVPVLLYTKIVELSDDREPRLIVTQPVARLEPGQSQRVRFVLNSNTPLQHEHIKRVYFEGVTEQTSDNSQISVSVRQDLPVIIVPKGLSNKRDMWVDLDWSVSADRLKVTNTGRHVVRLTPQITLQPAGKVLSLSKNYILPGESLFATVPNGIRLSSQQQVVFSPVTRYGFDVGEQKALLSGK
ncbi:fimbria/pilus chaperone family protein [Pragia fontium]|uniref:P pilus assembly protein, chaperone PapD n=1 Tax=Pragia fontium DSM 5563 = ATCC 49100 TaxID=1122977 RepID=A0AAJ4W7P8_9GAMM|nr:fimbria/pilus chaperone family protein [Pragia fontium]SFC01077.1 P pilus assembly protein, chaperone PapD [Pragia fontium DSM 5563 = ATCC 49100]VEJ54132.1 putative fimbrial chaperone protein [Pragia fontium]